MNTRSNDPEPVNPALSGVMETVVIQNGRERFNLTRSEAAALLTELAELFTDQNWKGQNVEIDITQ